MQSDAMRPFESDPVGWFFGFFFCCLFLFTPFSLFIFNVWSSHPSFPFEKITINTSF